MSFTVNQGRREIAIRMALGARSRKLLAGIFRRALRQLFLGAGIGLGVALWVQYKIPAARIGGLEVPGVLPSAIILILIVGLVAAFGPARRTLGIDPTEAIRNGT
jgi:putative ABC transport system permease protein